MGTLGSLYQEQGKYAEAEHLLTKALSVQRRVRGEDHPETLDTMNISRLAVRQRRQVRTS